MGIQKLVEVRSVSTVVPAIPTPPTDRYFLSNLDQVFSGQWYMNTVYYFLPPDPEVISTDPQKLVSSLKESLARTLVHYPVLAGRIKSADDGRLEVHFSDEGVPFKEAYVHSRFDDWEDIKDCPFELELNTQDTIITEYSTSPLLRIQINIFQCGGIALGFCWAHAIADGWAATEFVKAWSEVHQNIPISNPPHFVSTLLRARNPPRVTHTNKDYISTEKSANSVSVNNQIPEEAPSYQTIVVRLSAREVDDLVNEVETGPWKYGKASSFEAVAAFTWKVMTEARDLPDSTITKYVCPISCRQRWDDPCLPHAYFGNAAHLSCLPHKAGDIKKNHISYTAKIIHDDIAHTDTEYLKSAMDWMQIELEKGRDVGFNCDYYSGTDVQTTSFINFPVYETDFGWGKPFYYAFPIDPLFGDGLAFVLPAPEGGRSRCVPISMRQQHMKRLFENELFLKFLPNFNKNYKYCNK